ncbi:HesB/IscA family protein [Wolbachia endosymbiont of Dirofilaria (Dirofilaria) immitis]|uniref:HesB/IscA family protein n=1 Tax=Wolbachia endosymbiont of Dirofilaria (Dirofilaria) immitis TaxID=1812115 RepID=UPI00158A8C18|nr:iron-sulfur cluster biosynthesis family protein [Wolbachia endosymbiont of Dirofilaria (Dirofilaria) immitis]QKX02418.1 heme biosynthesis protein HemY [Wolbachia endosymbiont of Dirofilaria (Dirofilaria) immitis]
MSINYNINLTDSAIKKIYSLIEQEKNKNSVLRIAISGGGCSGFKYNFLMEQINKNISLGGDDDDYDYDDEFDDDEDDDYEDSEDYKDHSNFSKKGKDIIVNDENGKPVLMIDNCSAKFLNNSIIDYTENLSGSGFQINNALAKSRCGCGSSFSI